MTERTFSRRSLLGVAAGAGMTMAGIGVGAELALGRGRNGFASSFDTNGDGTGEMVIQRARRGVGGREGPLLNATTFGDETPDYAASLVHVSERGLSLEDLTSDEGFLYDYYENGATDSPGPDEAWVVLDVSGSGRHVLFRRLTDTRSERPGLRTDDGNEEDDRGNEGNGKSRGNGRGGDDDEDEDDEYDDDEDTEWPTRDVGREITGETYSAERRALENWREFDVNDQSIADVATNDLVDEFGADASVEWAGVGRGSPGWKSFVADTYYDTVIIAGEEVTLPVTDQRRGGPDRGPP